MHIYNKIQVIIIFVVNSDKITLMKYKDV